ncbi:MAG: TATA-box-binding protein [Methanobacteriota archaeon]|nr:MAG: TATA-box-binding protein [Euryarchaeota archaeon]
MAKNYTITNVVAAGNLGLELDLYKLPSKFKNIEYEPEQFPGAILKFNKPKATLLVFKNGKIVIVGCKDRKTIEAAIIKAYELLAPVASKIYKKLNRKKLDYEVTNMVAAADLEMEMDLFKVTMGVSEDIEYEPEQFPGAILKLRDPKISILVFKNGKLIIAGGRTKAEIEKALVKVKKILSKFAMKK